MRLSKAWIIAAKDLRIFWRNKSVLRSVIIFPLIVSIGLPLVIHFAGRQHGGISPSVLPRLLDAFSFFFIIGAAYLPTAIASYSLVGEKVEKSLEPLLATPIKDRELLLGKSIAAFLPSIVTIYIGAGVFMALINQFTHQTLGYSYFPNWTMGIILLLVAPLSAILSIQASVIISARASDVRSAQLLGGLMTLPFAAIYVASEIGSISLNANNLFIISAVILLVDAILFFISTKVFQREEILTKWT
jgi:ABC-2 type transport system permease protein